MGIIPERIGFYSVTYIHPCIYSVASSYSGTYANERNKKKKKKKRPEKRAEIDSLCFRMAPVGAWLRYNITQPWNSTSSWSYFNAAAYEHKPKHCSVKNALIQISLQLAGPCDRIFRANQPKQPVSAVRAVRRRHSSRRISSQLDSATGGTATTAPGGTATTAPGSTAAITSGCAASASSPTSSCRCSRRLPSIATVRERAMVLQRIAVAVQRYCDWNNQCAFSVEHSAASVFNNLRVAGRKHGASQRRLQAVQRVCPCDHQRISTPSQRLLFCFRSSASRRFVW